MRTGGKYLAVIISTALILSLLSAVITIYTPLTAFAAMNIWYVDQDAAGTDNGMSWTDAFNYLQDALAAATEGDQIWVAAGSYSPDQGAGNTPDDPAATFTLKNAVAIYGGFAGYETTLEERDWKVHKSILSGDLGGGLNSYHVVTCSSIGETSILDGFTITAGNANGSSSPNYHGGGVYNNAGNPSLINCTFSGNTANRDGGGMYNHSGSPNLTNCTFDQNTALRYGGGIYNYAGSPTLTHCNFSGNTAQSEGGGMFNFSGSNPDLKNCTFSDIYGYTGGAVLNNRSSGTFTNCIFTGNSAEIGAGMANFHICSPILINCIFTGNSASSYGGGMFNFDSDPTMVNCTFSGNSAVYGGGMDSYDSLPAITNCILWDNTSPNGAQLAVGAGSILAINNCDVQGGMAGIRVTGGGIVNWGAGNIDAIPEFADPDGLDNILGTTDDNLKLMVGSPCIDAGDNAALPVTIATDLDGSQRIIDGNNDGTATVDMGAYECEAAKMELPPPEDQIEDVISEVEDLVSDGALNKGQGNALVSKLESALSALSKGNIGAAVNKLQAFINQVNAYQEADILIKEDADSLRQAVEDVINSII
ncbi:MAG: right-handed parallel beta-helix repeat-containing protein [Dehalococcoidia bacterium]|nr:MAG: right-handed parallel beta-helix repeat-containing protein [Dehalococcoidia bacterium]